MTKYLLPLAILAGLGIAWVDSRPGWDDTAVTAFALLATAGVFSILEPRRPWLWALGVGIWIPLNAIVNAGNWTLLAVLAFPLAGAYGGMGLRRLIGAPTDL